MQITELNNKLNQLHEDRKQFESELFKLRDELKSEQKSKSQIENRISLFKNKEDQFKGDIKDKMITIEKLKAKVDESTNNLNDLTQTKSLLIKQQSITNSCKEFSYFYNSSLNKKYQQTDLNLEKMEKLFDKKTINNGEDKDDKDSVIKLGAKYNKLKLQFDEFIENNKICEKCGNDNDVNKVKEIGNADKVSAKGSVNRENTN